MKDHIWLIGFVAVILLVIIALQWPDNNQQQQESEGVTQEQVQQEQEDQNRERVNSQPQQTSVAADEYAIYGVSVSLLNDTGRAITWLSQKRIEQSVLQLKRIDDSWEKAIMIEADERSYTDREGTQIYAYTASSEQFQSGEQYHYRMIAGGQLISEEYTLHIADMSEESFQFIHITDSQGKVENDYKQWGRTLQAAIEAAPQAGFIVHSGDLTDDPTSEQQWKWFYHYAPAFSLIPFMPTTGNHEEIDGNAAGFSVRFSMPDNGATGSQQNTTYYTGYRNMLFISLNTEGNIKGQAEWLEQVLEEHRAQYQWVVVSMHRGVYGANRFKDGKDWVKLFDQYRVDLVLQGHNHQYSRSFPLVDGEIVNEQEKGTIYVTLNASGTKLNEEKKEKDYQAVAFQNGKTMYAVVDVSQEELIYSAFDISGKLLDQFRIASSGNKN
ncbi:metallophosphoesterase family protein [Paenibacillus camelliae]|uniref:metallophosphoesterase family protein n=1 Tax=Paenibacillus camelliae TaxID=512410 RepID=UPI00204161C1|nr:metallophosphoesterase family protein [Paenibacillus camelliae]MCM3632366.1 metallophosphoesterase [Paenibacillus camelliae]